MSRVCAYPHGGTFCLIMHKSGISKSHVLWKQIKIENKYLYSVSEYTESCGTFILLDLSYDKSEWNSNILKLIRVG